MESSHQFDKSGKITKVVSHYFDYKKLLNYKFYLFALNYYNMLIPKPQLSNKLSVHTKNEIFFLYVIYIAHVNPRILIYC